MRSLFEWLEAMPLSTVLRESIYGYPIMLTSHVVGMCVIAGLLIMMDLRLTGIGNLKTSVSGIQHRLFPWQMVGLVMASVSGGLLFYSQPMRFYGNFWFWIKMGLMGLAAVNAMWFHLTTYKTVAQWDTDETPPGPARLAGLFGLVLWSGVIVTGRMIAYSGLVPQWWIDLELTPY
jgi:hypothetical protein